MYEYEKDVSAFYGHWLSVHVGYSAHLAEPHSENTVQRKVTDSVKWLRFISSRLKHWDYWTSVRFLPTSKISCSFNCNIFWKDVFKHRSVVFKLYSLVFVSIKHVSVMFILKARLTRTLLRVPLVRVRINRVPLYLSLTCIYTYSRIPFTETLAGPLKLSTLRGSPIVNGFTVNDVICPFCCF